MKLRLIIRPDAAEELRQAKRWYEAQRVGLGVEFADEVSRVLRATREAPDRHAFVEGETRRVLLKRFPYGIFYRVRGAELLVVAVFHLHREPGVWRDRG